MEALEITPGLHVLPGAVNTGLLLADGDALLFDCCDTVTPERLAALGVRRVERILCTQHRRPNVAGAYRFVGRGSQLLVPDGERRLFDAVEAYWSDPANRWHLYHHQPGPQVLARSIPVAGTLGEGDALAWRGHTIRVPTLPGSSSGDDSVDAHMRSIREATEMCLRSFEDDSVADEEPLVQELAL